MIRIAVIEDDADTRELVGLALRKAGHQIAFFSGGQEFRQHSPEEFDILVCDLKLPGIDGEEIIRSASPFIPCIAYSAAGLTRSILSMAAGATAVVEKNGDFKLLRKTVERVLWANGKTLKEEPQGALSQLRELNMAAEARARLLAREH